jgi:NAD(P) transhydrogenase
VSAAPESFDWVVIGAGPAGLSGATEAARAGARVLLVHRDRRLGGECLHRGTIPSKTLRACAEHLVSLRARTAGVIDLELGPQTKLETLMRRLEGVVDVHERSLEREVFGLGIERAHARARFLSPRELELVTPSGAKRRVQGERVLIATGSRPRKPDEVPVDHEAILDSDSILSMIYLPRSLLVLGGGVIASEFATIFQALGVEVSMIDGRQRPLAFLDDELSQRFVSAFEADGGRFLGETKTRALGGDGLGGVTLELEDGRALRAEKALVALGRSAQVKGLELANAGLELNQRGHLSVDAHGRTCVPHIYAAGDVIGPPALAASATEQGRRAVNHALGRTDQAACSVVPMGIYTIPELASIGLTESEARARHGNVLVGRARFDQLARGAINGDTRGWLKLLAQPGSGAILGAHVLGDGAAELIHQAQLAMLGGLPARTFVEQVFNFPTLAEAYRVAAIEIEEQRRASPDVPAALPSAARSPSAARPA